MSDERLPSGSAPSTTGERPRAQVSYEGEDEFSDVSLSPLRRKRLNIRQLLKPLHPGERADVKVDELKSTNDHGIVGRLRKIFVK